MHQNIDLIELLRELNGAGANFVIVGAYAFAIHGRPRATKDVDIFVGSDPENAQRVWNALHAFGAPLGELRPSDLATEGTTEIDGVSFDEAWANRITSAYGGVPVSYLGKAELIRNKKAAVRPQDLADVAYLESESK